MSEHVTAQQIKQYRSKGMPPEELLAFDHHVAQCGECRNQLAGEELATSLLAGLASAAAPEHLSYDQMMAYVDAKSDDVDREIIESHVELCARCAAELGDLAAFAQKLSAEAEPGPMESQRLGLGAISLPRKVKIKAGEDEETKKR